MKASIKFLIFAISGLALLAPCSALAYTWSDNFDDMVWDDSMWLRSDTTLVVETGALVVNGSGGTQ